MESHPITAGADPRHRWSTERIEVDLGILVLALVMLPVDLGGEGLQVKELAA